jgi:hypothetical protein
MSRQVVLYKNFSTSVYLEPNVIKTLDEERGQQTRSSFINQLIKSIREVLA